MEDLDERFFVHGSLDQPFDPNHCYVIEAADSDGLLAFTEFCNNLVLDRDKSFTLERRKRLYQRWHGAAPRCMMAVKTRRNDVVGASVILPLNRFGYEQFCFGSLDAIEIAPEHLEQQAPQQQNYRYLLVDILARNKRAINALPHEEKRLFRGSALRYTLRHLAEFFDPARLDGPIVMVSTFGKLLSEDLRDLGFDRSCFQRTGAGDAPIFRLDLGRRDWYAPALQETHKRLVETVSRCRQ